MNPAVLRFWAQTRAGATAIVSVAIAVMTLGAVGLLVDHAWLVSQRDMLKSAADAASIAATLRLRTLPERMTDAEVEADLVPVARRYVEINVKANSRLETEVPAIALSINREDGLVGVEVTDPALGGTLMESFHSYAGVDSITVGAGAESDFGPVWAVLAIDVSKSMRLTLRGHQPAGAERSRMDIVKGAVGDFLDVLAPSAEKGISIGLVTWAARTYVQVSPSDTRSPLDMPIRRMRPVGGATGSTIGMAAARTLLASAPEDALKAIVLLTDGEDNRAPNGKWSCHKTPTTCAEYREAGCAAIKDAGIALFTVAAMHPSQVSGALGRELRQCATSESHAFINHSNAQALRDTFGQIGGQIKNVRRTR